MSERAENLIIHLLQEILQQFEGHSDGASVDFFWSLDPAASKARATFKAALASTRSVSFKKP